MADASTTAAVRLSGPNQGSSRVQRAHALGRSVLCRSRQSETSPQHIPHTGAWRRRGKLSSQRAHWQRLQWEVSPTRVSPHPSLWGRPPEHPRNIPPRVPSYAVRPASRRPLKAPRTLPAQPTFLRKDAPSHGALAHQELSARDSRIHSCPFRQRVRPQACLGQVSPH